MGFSAHLAFDGQCEAAFRFYEEVFRAKIASLIKWGESPAAGEAPPGYSDRILHASLMMGNTALFGADAFPGTNARASGFFVLFDVADPVEAERIFQDLAEGGSVSMPLQETFWARRFGVVTDRFGIPWEINCSKEH